MKLQASHRLTAASKWKIATPAGLALDCYRCLSVNPVGADEYTVVYIAFDGRDFEITYMPEDDADMNSMSFEISKGKELDINKLNQFAIKYKCPPLTPAQILYVLSGIRPPSL